MNQLTKVNWTTLIISLVALLNGACVQMGVYHLDNAQLQSLDNMLSVLVTFCGVVYHHRSPVAVDNVGLGEYHKQFPTFNSSVPIDSPATRSTAPVQPPSVAPVVDTSTSPSTN